MARATPYTNKAATVAMATLDAVVIGASILICFRGAPAGRLLPTEARDRPKSFGEPSSVRPVVIKPAISGVGMNHFGPLGGIAATFYGQVRSPKGAELSRGTSVARKIGEATGTNMKTPLILAISLICAAPLCAQDQQPSTVKLKADAQRVVGIIKGDKAKTQVYCEINDLGEQIGEADQRMDDGKAEALSRQVSELEKKLGPEYVALANDLNNVDPNSPEGRDIEAILAPLDDSCD